MKRLCVLVVVAGLLTSCGEAKEGAIEVTWEPVGIGGGGGVFTPSISPHDERLMFVACDMGGWYRSTDGGNHWRMCDGHQIRKVNFPAVFHPTDANVIYAGTRGGIKRSRDRGETWEHVVGKFVPRNPDMVRAIAIDPAKPEVILAGFNTYMGEKGEFLVQSLDGGGTWTVNQGWSFRDKPIHKILFDPADGGKQRILLATGGGFYRSDDDGASWVEKNEGLPNRQLRDCAAARDPKTGKHAIFLTLAGRADGKGKFAGGICKSTDAADTWQQVTDGLDTEKVKGKFHQYRFLAMSPTNTEIVSVSSIGTDSSPEHCSKVYRTADGGRTWKPILFGVPSWKNCNVEPDWMTAEMSWWWGGRACGFNCNPNDPNDLVFTDAGRAIRTKDGGKRWFPVSSKKVGKENWDGRGLEVTTSYEYYFDPHEPDRTYIAYTDFGFIRSLDRGKTWIYGARKVPWGNSCYELAIDPERKGVMFGVWGNAHDLIHWKMIRRGVDQPWWKGGVTKTTDHCETWKVVGRGTLPEKPATTIVLDPKSPKDSRTLYVGILAKGVYKSTDDGKTWAAKSKGLGTPDNMSVWRLDRHADGTLLCGISLNYKGGKPIGGALFRSTDDAGTWDRVNTTREFPYIWGVRMDPRDSKVIYLSCFDVPPGKGYRAMGTGVPWPKSHGGGLFKTTDGGKTWRKLLQEPYCWDVTFEPGNPDVVYAGTFVGGVYRSTDAGKTWTKLKGLPFVAPHRVTVDPENDKVIYVTTFGGGVWKGNMR